MQAPVPSGVTNGQRGHLSLFPAPWGQSPGLYMESPCSTLSLVYHMGPACLLAAVMAHDTGLDNHTVNRDIESVLGPKSDH